MQLVAHNKVAPCMFFCCVVFPVACNKLQGIDTISIPWNKLHSTYCKLHRICWALSDWSFLNRLYADHTQCLSLEWVQTEKAMLTVSGNYPYLAALLHIHVIVPRWMSVVYTCTLSSSTIYGAPFVAKSVTCAGYVNTAQYLYRIHNIAVCTMVCI